MKAEVALQVLSTRISVDRIGSSQKPRNKHSKARSSEAVLVPGGASRRALVRGDACAFWSYGLKTPGIKSCSGGDQGTRARDLYSSQKCNGRGLQEESQIKVNVCD